MPAALRLSPRALMAALSLTLLATMTVMVAGAVLGAAPGDPVYCFVPAPC